MNRHNHSDDGHVDLQARPGGGQPILSVMKHFPEDLARYS
jgi:hypothetical protein